MQFIKSILALVFLIAVGAGGIYTAFNKGLLPAPTGKLAQASRIFSWLQQAPFTNVTQTSGQHIQTLSAQAEQTASQAGAVLGSHIQVDESKTPIHQRAFETARYTYCQEVVKDYEQRQTQ